MEASKPCAAGCPARGHGAGFSPRQPPKFCRNIRNNCQKPCGPRQRAFRITRNKSATQAKLAGDSVAQRKFIRNAPATPDALSPLECCGVADKMATLGLPGVTASVAPIFKTSRQAPLLRFMALHAPPRRWVQPLSRLSSRLSWHDMLNPGDSIKCVLPIYSLLFETGSFHK
jgi:hypothetical protein